MRPIALYVCTLVLLGGCALPKLPTIGSLKEATGLVSTGASAHDAVLVAAAVADAWATDTALVDVRGTRIDSGGRDQGNHDGQWLVQFQSPGKQKLLGVTVINKVVKNQGEAVYQPGLQTVDRGLTGLLDSPDAVSKAGLGGHDYTVILRGDAEGPRYDVLADGAGGGVTLDARSGAKLTP